MFRVKWTNVLGETSVVLSKLVADRRKPHSEGENRTLVKWPVFFFWAATVKWSNLCVGSLLSLIWVWKLCKSCVLWQVQLESSITFLPSISLPDFNKFVKLLQACVEKFHCRKSKHRELNTFVTLFNVEAAEMHNNLKQKIIMALLITYNDQWLVALQLLPPAADRDPVEVKLLLSKERQAEVSRLFSDFTLTLLSVGYVLHFPLCAVLTSFLWTVFGRRWKWQQRGKHFFSDSNGQWCL